MVSSKNINNVFSEAEPDKDATVAKFATAQMKVASVFFAPPKQIFKTKESEKKSTVRNFLTVQTKGACKDFLPTSLFKAVKWQIS